MYNRTGHASFNAIKHRCLSRPMLSHITDVLVIQGRYNVLNRPDIKSDMERAFFMNIMNEY